MKAAEEREFESEDRSAVATDVAGPVAQPHSPINLTRRALE